MLTTGQRTRIHRVLVRALAAQRELALARHADPAALNRVFRRRTEHLRTGFAARSADGTVRESRGTTRHRIAALGPHRAAAAGLPAGADYSAWW